VRILVSTFMDGDEEKVLLAMRALPYDQLALIGAEDSEKSDSMKMITKLEGLSGHDVDFRPIPEGGFMEMVDSISEHLSTLCHDASTGRRNQILLNISGGHKIMGDAALFAAFRLGIESYHCDRVVTRLPVLSGATAKDRFTESQMALLKTLAERDLLLSEVLEAMKPNSKASAERTIRELRRLRLLGSRVEEGKVIVFLSPEGHEAARAIRFAK